MHWRRKWQPTPGESQGGGAWWAALYGVAQSQTRLKRLSSKLQLFSSPPPSTQLKQKKTKMTTEKKPRPFSKKRQEQKGKLFGCFPSPTPGGRAASQIPLLPRCLQPLTQPHPRNGHQATRTGGFRKAVIYRANTALQKL